MYINGSKSYAIKMTSIARRNKLATCSNEFAVRSVKIEMLEMIEYFYSKIRREGEKKFWFSKKKSLVSKITGPD